MGQAFTARTVAAAIGSRRVVRTQAAASLGNYFPHKIVLQREPDQREDPNRMGEFAPQPMFKKLPSNAALDETVEQFHILVDSVEEYAIYLLDAHGNIITWMIGRAHV